VNWLFWFALLQRRIFGGPHDWYENQRAGLGDEFLVFVAEALTRLEACPESYAVYYNGFRRIMTRRFPYKIFYRIGDGIVIVFRVLHAARDHIGELR
jgi:plasmid stabilization system protein ParE